jgi:hypothetical protein
MKHETVHALLVVSACQGLEVRHFDAKSAFLSREHGTTSWIHQERKEGLVVRLTSSIYGLKQSAHVWNKKVNKWSKDFHEIKQI